MISNRKNKVRQVETADIESSLPEKDDDALLLKVDHTHAGKRYEAGTPVSDLNSTDSSIAYMKEHGII